MGDGDDKTRVGKRHSMHEIPRLTEEQLRGYELPEAASETVSSTGGSAKTTGRLSLGNMRISEASAREVINRRLTMYGARLQSDYAFHEGTVLCTLDAYDPELGVGYAYISHADEDIVTDIDSETELALHELMYQNCCYVMVIHDSNVRSIEQLVIYVDQFLQQIPHPDELRQRRS